jgi:hypothetical protein
MRVDSKNRSDFGAGKELAPSAGFLLALPLGEIVGYSPQN